MDKTDVKFEPRQEQLKTYDKWREADEDIASWADFWAAAWAASWATARAAATMYAQMARQIEMLESEIIQALVEYRDSHTRE